MRMLIAVLGELYIHRNAQHHQAEILLEHLQIGISNIVQT